MLKMAVTKDKSSDTKNKGIKKMCCMLTAHLNSQSLITKYLQKYCSVKTMVFKQNFTEMNFV